MNAEADLGSIDKDGRAHALAGLLERLRQIAGPQATPASDDPAPPHRHDAEAGAVAKVASDQALDDAPDRDGRTSVARLMRTLGQASFTSLLLIPALIVVSPLSGIPTLPTVCGLSIALIAVQMSLGRDHIWLPAWLLRRSMDNARFLRALGWLDRPAGWIDAATAPRLGWLTGPPFRSLLLAACALAGGAMPLLELLPFTSSILATAVTLIAVGLLVGDGLVALLGLGFIAGGVAAVVWLVG